MHHYTLRTKKAGVVWGEIVHSQTRERVMVHMLGDRDTPRLLIRGKKSGDRPRAFVLVVPAGAKAGYSSAIILRDLARRGVRPEQFEVVVATSAGFLNAMGFCAGQHEVTPNIYLHLAARPWYFPAGFDFRWVTFYDYLIGILRGEVFGDVKLDVPQLLACPARKIAAVSDLYGGLHYHEITEEGDVFASMRAASAIPPFALGDRLGTHHAIDGAYAHAHCQFARIVRDLMRTHGPDTEICVLFVGNRPAIQYQHWAETLAYHAGVMASLWWSPPLMRSALALDHKIARSEHLFGRAVRKRTRLCALLPSPDEAIHPVEWRAEHMREQGEKIERSLAHLFETI